MLPSYERETHIKMLHEEQVGVKNSSKTLNLAEQHVVSKQLHKQAFLLLSYLDTTRKEKIKDGSTLILLVDAVVCHTL